MEIVDKKADCVATVARFEGLPPVVARLVTDWLQEKRDTEQAAIDAKRRELNTLYDLAVAACLDLLDSAGLRGMTTVDLDNEQRDTFTSSTRSLTFNIKIPGLTTPMGDLTPGVDHKRQLAVVLWHWSSPDGSNDQWMGKDYDVGSNKPWFVIRSNTCRCCESIGEALAFLVCSQEDYERYFLSF